MQIIEISEPNISETKDEFVVGIDFGTTNSLIAISKNYQVEIIKMQNGLELLPSIIAIENNKMLVGAKPEQSQTVIRSIKRLFAKSSEEIKNHPNLLPFANAIDLSGELPKLAIAGTKISLPEAAASIFRHLKSQAELALKSTVEKAVISVPAYFDDSARGCVLLAAKLAGFEVMRLISEPTAAAYAYGLNKSAEGAYLVYDLGGGTFDVSILNMQTGILQVVATGGDNMLGGDDIDMLFAQYIADKLKVTVTKEIIALAKSAKEELSSQLSIHIRHPLDDGRRGLVITKAEYEEIISPLIAKTIKIVKDTIHDAQEVELTGIILVGGSTRIPLITSKLKETFRLPIYADLDPDKIVAYGAALQAENLSSKAGSLLIDVVPLSVGLELYGGIAEKIILRNTPIPFSVTKEFTTHADNQTGIQFHIVQGEREMVRDCRSLAHFELSGIPPMQAGRVHIEATFAMDVDGILSITAQETITGKSHNLEIRPSYGLSEKEINEALNIAFANAEKDHAELLLAESRQTATSLISGLQKAIAETPDILAKMQMQKINNAINALQKAINKDNRDNILMQIDSLNSLASSFINKHLDKGVQLHLKNRHIDEV